MMSADKYKIDVMLVLLLLFFAVCLFTWNSVGTLITFFWESYLSTFFPPFVNSDSENLLSRACSMPIFIQHLAIFSLNCNSYKNHRHLEYPNLVKGLTHTTSCIT